MVPSGACALIERLKPRIQGIPTITICLVAEEALRHLEIEKMAIVNSAWFDDDLDAAGAAYRDLKWFITHPVVRPAARNT